MESSLQPLAEKEKLAGFLFMDVHGRMEPDSRDEPRSYSSRRGGPKEGRIGAGPPALL